MKNITMRQLSRPETYPLHCARFLENARPLDEWIAKRNLAAANFTMSHDAPLEAKRIVAKSGLSHMLNSVASIRHPLKHLGLSLTSVFLPENLREDLRASAIVKQADQRAEFLLPQIGEEYVAMLIPKELRTEQAAAYMRQRKHESLHIAIHASLQLPFTPQPLSLG